MTRLNAMDFSPPLSCCSSLQVGCSESSHPPCCSSMTRTLQITNQPLSPCNLLLLYSLLLFVLPTLTRLFLSLDASHLPCPLGYPYFLLVAYRDRPATACSYFPPQLSSPQLDHCCFHLFPLLRISKIFQN